MLSIGAVGAPEAGHEFKGLASLIVAPPDPDILFDIIRMDELRPAPIAELIEPQPGELCPLPVQNTDISICCGSEDLLRHRLCAGAACLHDIFNTLLLSVQNYKFYLVGGTKTCSDGVCVPAPTRCHNSKGVAHVKDARFIRLGPRSCWRPLLWRRCQSPDLLSMDWSAVTSPLPSTGWLLASSSQKANVYDPSENKIGDVTHLIIDSNAKVTAAVIVSVGGFIGVGQKDDHDSLLRPEDRGAQRQGIGSPSIAPKTNWKRSRIHKKAEANKM